MSMLGSQCERLKDRAHELQMLASGMDAPYIVQSTKLTMAYAMSSAASEMREAADTIENLRNRLQPVPAELDYIEDKSRWFELFGTPERAARTLAKACGECSEKFPCSECPLSPIVGSNVYEPEILEWLRGESE